MCYKVFGKLRLRVQIFSVHLMLHLLQYLFPQYFIYFRVSKKSSCSLACIISGIELYYLIKQMLAACRALKTELLRTGMQLIQIKMVLSVNNTHEVLNTSFKKRINVSIPHSLSLLQLGSCEIQWIALLHNTEPKFKCVSAVKACLYPEVLVLP